MTSPSLAVVVATHNGERFIAEQLASILGGTLRPDQVIVADDDSTDRTVDIARTLLQESGVAHEIVVNRPALGVALNVARAIARTRADVVVLSDQDDRWHPDRLEEVARAFSDPEVVLQHGDAELVDGDGRELGSSLFEWLEVTPAEISAIRAHRAFDVYLRRNLATGATSAVRRAAIADGLEVPAPWLHDEWFAAIASTRGRVELSPHALVDYRLHGANQIGVAAPTLGHKVRRVLIQDAERLPRLADRSAALVEFLEASNAATRYVVAAREKAEFEARRARLPRLRIARLPGVLSGLARGRYARYASRGRLDALRDLIQPR